AALELPHMFPVFEINGLPSIELPYRYPFLDKGTLEKIRKIEANCIKRCGKIIVPSWVIRDYLVGEGVSKGKITVITNGASIPENVSEYPGLPEKYVLYFGALQSWQGVHPLLKSFNYLQDIDDLFLVICSSQPEKQVRPYKKIVSRLKLEDKVAWRYQLGKDHLNSVIKQALCTVAPLSECTRNIKQGCSPLKIFESLANSTPVIASDLPVVREIMNHGKEGLLVPPDRPADLARAIRQMVEGTGEREEMGRRGLRLIQEHYQWKSKQQELAVLYESCIGLMV
ncbi:MAG: glycosyltransferase, partial [Cyclobacteriaceae bacterium]|nr:glycosyltransferase [Cyclobacteriaceae bacterium]